MAHVSVTGVSKFYGGKHGHKALSDISLVAGDGEFLVLLGPSGSGKTTLLRTIAGLENVDVGDIHLGERRITNMDPGLRNIGMVFQDYALYPHMTVRDNIGYNIKLRKIERTEIERRVREVAVMLGIGELLDRRPSQLSGGQRQRVALARAITRQASVLLMDEPLSNLDAQIREHVRVELKELQRRLGVTTIYVTHDQVEAMVMADRIAVMSEGKVEQIGPPDEIYDKPQTLFCMRFVGSPKANELRGKLRAAKGGGVEFVMEGDAAKPGLVVTIDAGEMDLSDVGSGDVILAFRPEDVQVRRESGAGFPASLVFVENRGAEKYAVVEIVAPFRKAQISADLRLKIDEAVVSHKGDGLSFMPRRVHLFDEATGRRIATGSCRVKAAASETGKTAHKGSKRAGDR